MFLNNIVTPELSKVLVKSVHNGYKFGRDLMKNHEEFDSIIGRETIPYVKRLAIEFYLWKYTKGVEGLEVGIYPNKSGNYHHVELRFKNIIITNNHLSSINGIEQEFPRFAYFRDKLLQHNIFQEELFPTPQKDYYDEIIFAPLIHTGKYEPKKIALMVLDSTGSKSLEILELNVPEEVKNFDDNVFEDVKPELKEFSKIIGKHK